MALTRIWDADNNVWQVVGGDAGYPVSDVHYIDSVTPTDPADGLLWTNPATGITQIWDDDGAAWIPIGGGGGGGGGDVPVGAIMPYAGASAPTGYLICDGSARNRTTYADLFAVVGETYGVGDGSTTFNIPDLRQRFPLGLAAAGIGSTLGGTGGAIGHTHTGPSHTHTGPSHIHTMPTHVHTGPSHVHTGPSHSHTGPSHTHTWDGATEQGGGHSHTFSDTSGTPSIVASYLGGGINAGTGLHTHSVSGTTSSAATHAHNIVGGPTGAAGTGATGSSGTANTGSSGTANTGPTDPGDTDPSGTAATGASGTAATGSADPPFLAVNYIIKV